MIHFRLHAELYLLAFGPLRTVFEERELIQFGEAMMERDIRLREGLPAVGEVEDGTVKTEEDSGEEGDEIEHDARELRRLKPY